MVWIDTASVTVTGKVTSCMSYFCRYDLSSAAFRYFWEPTEFWENVDVLNMLTSCFSGHAVGIGALGVCAISCSQLELCNFMSLILPHFKMWYLCARWNLHAVSNWTCAFRKKLFFPRIGTFLMKDRLNRTCIMLNILLWSNVNRWIQDCHSIMLLWAWMSQFDLITFSSLPSLHDVKKRILFCKRQILLYFTFSLFGPSVFPLQYLLHIVCTHTLRQRLLQSGLQVALGILLGCSSQLLRTFWTMRVTKLIARLLSVIQKRVLSTQRGYVGAPQVMQNSFCQGTASVTAN